MIRPSAVTAVASRHSSPAPDSASEPRCATCQSVALPSTAEYWHIGDTMMRLGSVRPRSVIGSKRRGMVVEWAFSGHSVDKQDGEIPGEVRGDRRQQAAGPFAQPEI